MLTGAIRPTDGFHVVGGKHSTTEMPEIRQQLGICLQHNDCLFPKLTCEEHLEFFYGLRGSYQTMSRQEVEEKVEHALKDVALEEKRATLSMHLSGGMKRKLCIAIAFAGDSNVVILDEPTSGMVRCRGEFSGVVTSKICLAHLHYFFVHTHRTHSPDVLFGILSSDTSKNGPSY